MAAPSAVEEGGLVDDVRAAGHGPLGFGRRGPQLFASILDGAVERDLHDGPSLGVQLGEVPALVLLSAPAQDVELGIVQVRPVHEAGTVRRARAR